jgi:cytochrome b6-f complex iron-sulfur subunit
MADAARTRRSVVRTLIFSFAGAAGLRRFLTPTVRPQRPATVSVATTDVPMNGALVLANHRCAVVRRPTGAFAVDLTCAHLACMVTATPDGFVCPCHGSRYDQDGRVLEGPTSKPLTRLALEERDGIISVFRA